MKITEESIAEIAELLECGLVCFYHRPTGAIESMTNPDSIYFESGPWQDVIDKVESDTENYIRFEQMNSNEGFRLMENFASSLADSEFRQKLFDKLSRPRPFQHFKVLIESSNYRQDWFDFKSQAYKDFVKGQIELED